MKVKKLPQTLIIVGCGPKALAIYIKASVLKKLGWKTPRIVIIDKSGIAVNWTGEEGFTDGQLPLETPPQKDIGYPYQSLFGKSVDREMQMYSWSAYLIDTNQYSEWVDRGTHNPPHSDWADYLKWVAKTGGLQVEIGEVFKINRDRQWTITYRKPAKRAYLKRIIKGEGLVITGPGDPIELPTQGRRSNKVLNTKNFWQNLELFRNLRNTKIAVIGGGESAASIVLTLLKLVDVSTVQIEIINQHGSIFTRSENYFDNRFFSNPSGWQEMSEQYRLEFIKRADLGTFSLKAKEIIDIAKKVKMVPGKSEYIKTSPNTGFLELKISNGRLEKFLSYNYIVVATGFNSLSFTKLFSSKIGLKDKRRVERSISHDLSIKNMLPKLYLPTLAGLVQGPGFPILSCLGLLSDRILETYCTRS